MAMSPLHAKSVCLAFQLSAVPHDRKSAVIYITGKHSILAGRTIKGPFKTIYQDDQEGSIAALVTDYVCILRTYQSVCTVYIVCCYCIFAHSDMQDHVRAENEVCA